jgi:O-antigen/teichoic acid export membrane protein
VKPVELWRKALTLSPVAANTAITAGANLALAVFGFFTGILAARLLGPDGRGELAAIQTAPSFVAALSMLGLPEALTYFSAQNPSRAGRYLSTAILVATVASIPFMIGGFFAMPLLLNAQSIRVIVSARWYLLIGPIWAFSGMLPNSIRGLGDLAAWNAMRLMVPVCTLTVLLVAAMTGSPNARFIAFGTLAFNAVLSLPFSLVIRRRLSGPYLPEQVSIEPMLKYGVPCALTGLPQTLNLRLDQMLMAAVLSPRDLGLYVIAVAWSGAVSPLLNSIGAAILPSIASATSRELAISRLIRGIRATSILAFLISALTLAITPIGILFLFGATYRSSIPSALVLVPAAGVLGVNFALQESIRGLGFPYAVLRAEMLGLVATGISLALMLKPLGILGAAVSSIFGYSVVTIALLASASALTDASIKELLIPTRGEIVIGFRRAKLLARTLVAF